MKTIVLFIVGSVLFFLTANIALSQVNTFPLSESFEDQFVTGTDVEFIQYWKGNDVRASSRIFQGNNARTGSHSLNVIPISSFSGEIILSLDLSGLQNPKFSFYAYSKQNGSSSSTRPALVTISASIDGGANYLGEKQIGDETTFPNNNETSYAEYDYEFPTEALGQANVLLRIEVERGAGSGSAAEFVMDDVSITDELKALAVNSVSAFDDNTVIVTFNQDVVQATAEETSNYQIDNGVSVNSAALTSSKEVTLTTSALVNGNYQLTVNNVEDAATNTAASNLTADFSYVKTLSLVSTEVLSKSTLALTFNLALDKNSAETTSNYVINKSIGNPINAELNSTEPNKVLLTLATNLEAGTYEINVDGVQDESNLATANSLIDSFGFLPLKINSVVASSSETIVITFNQEVEELSAERVSNYSIGNDISIISADLTASDEVTLSVPTLVNGNYTLNVNDVKNSNGNALTENLFSNFSYIETLKIDEVKVLSKNTLKLTFNLDLDKVSTESTSNYSISNSIGNPFTAALDSAEPNKVLLTLSSDLEEEDYEITVNGVQDESTLSTADEKENFSYLPLKITSISALNAFQIEVEFNQEVEPASATNPNHYNLNYDYGNPGAVLPGDTESKVLLSFASEMVNNIYSLTVNGVLNSSGNASAENLTEEVLFETQTPFRTLVINEIFADPSGSAQPDPQTLPSGSSDEFIELYNVGSKAINISGFDLSGGTVGSFVIEPNDFVMLTATSNIADFEPLGNVVGVSSWNGLSNSGEQIVLRDNLGNLVDSLSFNLGWYRNSEKADGGWSLEQINPESTCSDINNWKVSENEIGATPGTENSIYDNSPDITAPNLLEIMVDSPSQLTLVFDELMDEPSLNNASFALDHGATVASVAVNQLTFRSAILTLASPLESGNVYTLNVEGARDCSGNLIQKVSKQFLFDNAAPILQRLVFRDSITLELYFDENLNETQAEKEEHYIFDSGIGIPARAILEEGDLNKVKLTLANSLVLGTTYQLHYENLEDTLGNATTYTTYDFEFVNELDNVQVISGQLLDIYLKKEVTETSAEIVQNFIVTGNVGNPVTAALDQSNSKLIHLAFAENFKENTPQTISFSNLESADDGFLQVLNAAFIYDTDDPDIDSVRVDSSNQLEVFFDEELDRTSAEALNNYTANNDLGKPQSAALQTNRKSVLLEFKANFQQETSNRLTITGISDLRGNTVSTNRNISFIFDQLAPRIEALKVKSPKEILLIFTEEVERTSAEASFNYELKSGLGSPISANRSDKNTNEVLLTFSDLGSSETNTLTVSNVRDQFGNGIDKALGIEFSTQTPEIGSLEVLNDTAVFVQFTKVLELEMATDRINFGFDQGMKIQSLEVNSNDNSQITFFLSSPLIHGATYQFFAQQVEDIEGNISGAVTTPFVYNAHLEDISIINQNTLILYFDEELDKSLAESSLNYQMSGDIGNPLSAIQNSENAKEVTLLFDSPLANEVKYTLTVQNLKNIYGELVSGSRSEVVYDITPPTALRVKSIYLNEIEVVFNEPLKASTVAPINHYSLSDGIGNPLSAELVAGSNSNILLTFDQPLENGKSYQLQIERIQDRHGEAMAPVVLDFTFKAPEVPSFRDLVLNEIYFDTDADSGLPNTEYIEIYNRSGLNFLLRDFMITDKSDTAVFNDVSLSSKSYLITTSSSSQGLFNDLGSAVGLKNFPSLSNSGEQIYLLDRNGVVVDSLAYDVSFYHDESKEDGGYSVELINPDRPCFDLTNYTASIDASGGTPGQQNSVYDITPDTEPPLLLSVTLISDSEIELIFNEVMDISSFQPSEFSLTNNLSVSTIEPQDEFGKRVLVKLTSPIPVGSEVEIGVEGVLDCSGNVIEPIEFSLALGAIPDYHQLLITEIMATPSPAVGLPEVEFVEVYNNSDQILEMKGLLLSDNSGTTKLDSKKLYPNSYLILASKNSEESLSQYGDVLAVSSFPSFGTEDQVRLEDPSGNLIFEVFYDRSFYQSEKKENGGYSMEMVNPDATCFDNSNWKASTNPLGGTPGQQNSVYDITPDTEPPLLLSVTLISDSEIELIFNEAMDISSFQPSAFSLTNNLSVSAVEPKDEFGKRVLVKLASPIPAGSEVEISIEGLKDCTGNEIVSIIEAIYLGARPGFQELIITEIMADPSPTQGLPSVEYVELYNASNKILSLAGVSFSDASSSTLLGAFNLKPSEFVILSSFSDVDKLKGYGDILGVSGWPSLNSSRDKLSLKYETQLIHAVEYSIAWYRSSDKSEGGYSLEMIDMNYPCVEQPNWTASEATIGGSPGAVNSVNASNPDLMGPELISAVALSASQIQVTFTEKITINSLVASNFKVSGDLNVVSVSITSDLKSVILNLNEELLENNTYTITAENITDCSGNLVPAESRSIALVISVEAEPKDLLINEVLFNPRTGGVRFVEIYNNSNKQISLKNYKLAGSSNEKVIAETDLIIAPSEYLVLTTDGDILKNHYANTVLEAVIEMKSFPSLSSDEGEIKIFNSRDIEIDAFSYSEDYHSSLLSSVDGVSLERIRFSGESNDFNNWQSASAAIGFATPGFKNSQTMSEVAQIHTVSVEPQSFAPDAVGAAHFTTFNYEFNNSGNMLKVDVYDGDGNLVKRISENTLVGTSGFFTWDGSTQFGTKAKVGYYLVLFEIIKPSGEVDLIKKSVAIGSSF